MFMKKNVNTGLPWQSSGLRLCPSTAGDADSIPGWETKILHTAWCGQKKKTKEKMLMLFKDFKEDLNRGVYNVCG